MGHRLRPGSIAVSVQPSKGLAESRNMRLAATHGGLIAFLDTDDEMLPGPLDPPVGVLVDRPDISVGYRQAEFFDDETSLPFALFPRTSRRGRYLPGVRSPQPDDNRLNRLPTLAQPSRVVGRGPGSSVHGGLGAVDSPPARWLEGGRDDALIGLSPAWLSMGIKVAVDTRVVGVFLRILRALYLRRDEVGRRGRQAGMVR
jgi:Glycosyl transferase family 2